MFLFWSNHTQILKAKNMNSMNLIAELDNKCCLIIIHILEIWINKTTPSTANKDILFHIIKEIIKTTMFEYVCYLLCYLLFLCFTIKDDAFFYF